MNYGLPPAEHLMKVHPWTVRLQAATRALQKAIKKGDRAGMIKGIEDTSFWSGRIICDGIGAESKALDESKKFTVAVQAIISAQKAIIQAKQSLSPSSYSGTTKKPLSVPIALPACVIAIIIMAGR